MEFFTIVLLGSVVLKYLPIMNAVRWLALHGEQHARELRRECARQDPTRDQVFRSFEKHSGKFFPFGVKDYRLIRVIHELQASSGRLHRFVGRAIELCRKVLFQYFRLSVLVSVYVCGMALAHRFTWFAVPESHQEALFWLGVGTFVLNLLMAVEFVFGHIFLSNYGQYFHMLSPRKMPLAGGSDLVLGIQIVIAVALMVVLTGTATVFSSHLMFDAFKGEILPADDSITDTALTFGYCTYFTLTTLTTTGYGDITPNNGYGATLATLLQVESAAVILFVLAVFLSIRNDTTPEGNSSPND